MRRISVVRQTTGPPGTSAGIGMRFTKALHGPCKIISIVPGGPASYAQVRLDEYIHELNGIKVYNMSVQDVVGQILGKHGTVLVLFVSDREDPYDSPQQPRQQRSEQLLLPQQYQQSKQSQIQQSQQQSPPAPSQNKQRQLLPAAQTPRQQRPSEIKQSPKTDVRSDASQQQKNHPLMGRRPIPMSLDSGNGPVSTPSRTTSVDFPLHTLGRNARNVAESREENYTTPKQGADSSIATPRSAQFKDETPPRHPGSGSMQDVPYSISFNVNSSMYYQDRYKLKHSSSDTNKTAIHGNISPLRSLEPDLFSKNAHNYKEIVAKGYVPDFPNTTGSIEVGASSNDRKSHVTSIELRNAKIDSKDIHLAMQSSVHVKNQIVQKSVPLQRAPGALRSAPPPSQYSLDSPSAAVGVETVTSPSNRMNNIRESADRIRSTLRKHSSAPQELSSTSKGTSNTPSHVETPPLSATQRDDPITGASLHTPPRGHPTYSSAHEQILQSRYSSEQRPGRGGGPPGEVEKPILRAPAGHSKYQSPGITDKIAVGASASSVISTAVSSLSL